MIKLLGQSIIMNGDETFSVKRFPKALGSTANYVDGKLVQAPPVVFCAKGTIQPLVGRELMLVPEADRFMENYWLYVPSQIFTLEDGLEVQDITSMKINDMVVRNCGNFQVQTIEDWGSYCRARIMRIDTGPNATP